jgi:PAS domain S-box-containing protein
MKYRHFDSSIVGKDKTIVDNILRTVIDDNYTSVMLTKADSGYTILYVNEAFTELTGYSIEEVIGKGPSFLQGPKTDRKLIEHLNQTLSSGYTFQGRTVNYRKDGSEFIMEWRILPINDSDNQITHFLAVQREGDVNKN